MNKFEQITNEMGISAVCEICETICEEKILLEPLGCGHVFHYECLLINNVDRKKQCSVCKSNHKELFYSTPNNIHTRVMVKNYDRNFRLGQSHLINSEIKGYSFLLVSYNLLDNHRPMAVKIKVKDSDHVRYFNGRSEDDVKEINKGSYKHLTTIKSQFHSNVAKFVLKPTISNEEILDLKVEFVKSLSRSVVFICKILIKDGLTEKEFPGMLDLSTILKYVSIRNPTKWRPTMSMSNKLCI